ncbi:MAG: gamma-glutamyltransferase [Cycloclasticus sp.]|nr:MAG: gamma-glutamyltransferase [Cycloclasticus sp.]
MQRHLSIIFVCALLFGCANNAIKPNGHAIASAHPAATQAGLTILNKGGNAFDAAVAVSAALAVVEPRGSGIGGGGFWLLHQAKTNRQVMIDGREVAPNAAHKNMFLDEFGVPNKNASVNGVLSAGIPGMPAGLVHLSKHYGVLPLSTSLQPAIALAEQGFKVNGDYHRSATFRQDVLAANKSASDIFLVDGKAPAIGSVIKQPDLANTLRLIAAHGFDGFYRGELAKKLVDGVRANGGIWTEQDLASYTVKERNPIVISYNDMKITSAVLPSSGGLVLSIALNILEQYNLSTMDEATRAHVIVEAMRRAYRDRALYMGDTDFVDVPINMMTKKSYAINKMVNFRLDKATASESLTGLNATEARDTTHFSVIDKEGNRVAATLSVNYPFGSCFVAPGTGVLLNDEMDDFSKKPGVPNIYGLVGGSANAIEPGKRMLSSMSPTFIETDDVVGILGTPGGSRIISMVLLAILDAEKGNGPISWVSLPRFHHQYLPDEIQYEPNALSDEAVITLKQKGHHLKLLKGSYGNMHAVMWDKKSNRVQAASDPRLFGKATVENKQ